MTARVTVVGSLNMDLIVRTPRLPQRGETITGSDFHTAAGGKGANQAVATARLGARVAMVGRVGNDAFGDTLLDAMIAADLDCTHIGRDPAAATGVALITVDDAGDNTIAVIPGANGRLSVADVDVAESVLTAADVLLLQLESPLDVVIRAAQVAHARKVRVILNPAPACPLPDELLAAVDVLAPNESETAFLTGRSVASLDEARAAAHALLEWDIKAAILTLGERGALLAQRQEPSGLLSTSVVPAFSVTPVDTTAAGDAFMAGLAVALAEGNPLAEAVRWGNAAGALATTKMGAQPSLPCRAAVEMLLAEGTTRSV